MPASRKKKAATAPAPKRYITLRINPERLNEDELDYLYYLKHKDGPSYSFETLLHRLGYEVVAKGKGKR